MKYIPTKKRFNVSNRLIYNLAADTRLNGGSQDFLCFPDQKTEKSAC